MLWLASLLTGETARKLSRVRPSASPSARQSRNWLTRAGEALSNGRAALADYRARRAATRELNRLSDRMLHDIGMTRDDVPRVIREMIERRSRRPAHGKGASAARAQRTGERSADGCCAGA